MAKPLALILSCEHGGNRIPKPWRPLFKGESDMLRSHRGSDAGALALARHLARAMRAPLHASDISRLLIDLNRSLHHPRLLSEVSRRLSRSDRTSVIETVYHPYRRRIQDDIGANVAAGSQVLHISVHSFVAQLDGVIRKADIGLLYDPARPGEKEFCRSWQVTLATRWSVRLNYPYRGVADGLTTYLRGRYGADDYLGIELEVNQNLLASRSPASVGTVGRVLAESLQQTIRGLKPWT